MAYQHHKTLKSLLILIFFIFGIFTIISIVYVLKMQHDTNSSELRISNDGSVVHVNKEYSTASGITSNTPTCYLVDNVATTTDEHGMYTTGYGLFVQQEYDKPISESSSGGYVNPCPPTYPVITYIDEGDVESGVYKGYHRIIGFRTWDGPGGDIPTPYFFITKDYKTYKLVTHSLLMAPTNIENSTKSHLAYFQETVNRYKVTGLVDDAKDHIDFPHAPTIQFGSLTYVLTQINTTLSTTSKKLGITQDGLDIYNDPLGPYAHFGAYNGYMVRTEEESNELNKPFDMLKDYYEGTTKIHVKNTLGIFADYALTLKTTVKPQEYNNPFLYGSDIKNLAKKYTTYSQVTPSPCGINPDMYVSTHITDSDVKKIGQTKYGLDLYAFTNINNPILKAQYIEKIGQYGTNTQAFMDINSQKGYKTMPTYEQYVAKNPVLFFKDVWNRWVIVGEFDYMLDGGCGKPVIYLYPEKTTDVHIDFKHTVQLTTDIPAYNKGWNVRAEPDGTLQNIVPEMCDRYTHTKHGSEYAYDACKKNEYPYIYWAGNVFQEYPTVKEGFVVSVDTLKKTLEEKLVYIGLNQKEVSDFVEYWYPEMIKKNAPFYRISFMQNEVLNRFIPMKVTPSPDTSMRVFLDWEPLTEFKSIPEQSLVKITRQGFTYVEWGGLRR